MEAADKLDKSTREEILQVTIDLIRSNRLDTLTVRQIAKAVNVNVGAINYYFGSKENLLIIAVKEILMSIKENFSFLDDLDLPPKERLRNFLTVFTGNHPMYLNCLRWMFSKTDSTFRNGYEYSSYLKEFGSEKVKSTISEITGETDPTKLGILSIQLVCAAVGPNIVIPKICHPEFADVKDQIDILLTHFFTGN